MKKLIICSIVMIFTFSLLSCRVRLRDRGYQNVSMDELTTLNKNVEINFTELSDDVINDMLTMKRSFFFIAEDGIKIIGSNNPKQINLSLTCMEEVPKTDVEVVLSCALNLIGSYCAQQDFNYKAPTIGDDNVYKDFGSVFNSYRLILKAQDVKGNVIFDENIAPGSKIPIDPQYIMEE